jgi:hypothetical protein
MSRRLDAVTCVSGAAAAVMCAVLLATTELPLFLAPLVFIGGCLSGVVAVAHRHPALGRTGRAVLCALAEVFCAFGRRRQAPALFILDPEPPSPAALAADRIVADARSIGAALAAEDEAARVAAHRQLQDAEWCAANGMPGTAAMLRMVGPTPPGDAPRVPEGRAPGGRPADSTYRPATAPGVYTVPGVRPSTTDLPPPPPLPGHGYKYAARELRRLRAEYDSIHGARMSPRRRARERAALTQKYRAYIAALTGVDD